MDCIWFNESNHTYENLTKDFTYSDSASHIAGVWAGHKSNMYSNNNYAEVGTNEHLYFEKYIRSNGCYNKTKSVNWFDSNCYRNYSSWLSEEILYTEGLLIDYAGKSDLIAEKDGKYTIFDIKTGSRDRRYWEYQLSLYRYAFCQMRGLKSSDINLKIIFIERKNNELQEPRLLEFKGISDEELMTGLECYAEGIPYKPFIEGLDK